MMTSTQPARSRSRRVEDRRYYGSFALLVVVCLLIIWQAVTYRGVIAVLAEWQFDVLGRYHPILTLLMLAALFGIPLYLLGFVRSRRARRRAALPRHAARRAMRLARVLLASAVALAITALVAFALIWTLPPTTGAPVRVAVTAAVATAASAPPAPPLGPVTLTGEVVYDRITALDEKLWFLGRSIRFVPVVAPGGGGRGSTLRFFVAVPRFDPGAPDITPRAWTGTLRKGGLPGEIVRLYRYAGYRVETPYYVLFTRPEMLTWPFRLLALQFTLGALVALLGGLLQLAHARRMLRALETEADAEPESVAPAEPADGAPAIPA